MTPILIVSCADATAPCASKSAAATAPRDMCNTDIVPIPTVFGLLERIASRLLLSNRRIVATGNRPILSGRSTMQKTLEKNASTKRVSAKRTASFARGVHHLALCTDDIKKTTEFYTRVLGMPLVHALKVPPGLGTGPANRGNPPYEEIRHYFFDMGHDSLLAFFEIPRGAEPKVKRDAIGGMQHVAFAVTPPQFAALQERLRAAKVSFDGPIDILP